MAQTKLIPIMEQAVRDGVISGYAITGEAAWSCHTDTFFAQKHETQKVEMMYTYPEERSISLSEYFRRKSFLPRSSYRGILFSLQGTMKPLFVEAIHHPVVLKTIFGQRVPVLRLEALLAIQLYTNPTHPLHSYWTRRSVGYYLHRIQDKGWFLHLLDRYYLRTQLWYFCREWESLIRS